MTVRELNKKFKVIDLTYLLDMSDSDLPLAVEVIDIFKSQLPDFYVKYEFYLSENNLLELQKLTHKTRSAFNVVGIVELTGLQSEIDETRADNLSREMFERFIVEYRKTIDKALVEIQEFVTLLKNREI